MAMGKSNLSLPTYLPTYLLTPIYSQVAFKEFYNMVLHPDLVKYDCRAEAAAAAGGPEGADPEAMARRKQVAEKKGE